MTAPKLRPIRDIHAPAAAQQPRKRRSWKLPVSGYLSQRWVQAGVLLVVVFAGVVFARNYLRTRDQMVYNDPSKLAAKIGQFLELPTDEPPTLATVKDVNKLRGQAFFKNAQDGDKVLIFTKSGKAVLYRPATQKVIEFTPINLSAPSK